MRDIFEDLNSRLQGSDEEVEMAITDLKAIADMASKLAIYFQDNNPSQLEGWVQAKITKAADYMEAAYKNTIYSGDHFEE